MKKVKNWIPALVVMAIIFAFSSIKGATINEMGLGKESLHINGHFVLFVMLCFAYYKATKNVFLSVIFTVFYGTIDEFHQFFVPGRSASYFDIFVDSTGAVLSGVILWKLQHYLPTRLKTWLNN